MIDYLSSKVAEYSVLIKLLETEIQDLRSDSNVHTEIIDYFEQEVQELKQSHTKLKKIACIDNRDSYNVNFNARAVGIIRNIETKLLFIVHYYFPALLKENDNDNFIRKIIFDINDSCGLFWIKDILVSLDRPYAILPVFNEIPIIYAPMHQFNSLLGLPIFHHELGHSIFKQFGEIGENLNVVINDHFELLKRSSGSLTPDQKNIRDQNINSAIMYWNIERLNEIFCDIFATYVCGPANYYSNVDTAIKNGDIFNVFTHSPHPPWAVRVLASYNTLQDDQKSHEIVEIIKNSWEKQELTDHKHPIFDLYCSEELINKIINQAVFDIEEKLAVKRCSKLIDSSIEIENVNNFSIQEILNNGLHILLKDPKGYIPWESDIISQLRSC